MKPLEIVEKIRAAEPESLGKVPDKRAALIIRKAFAELAKTISETGEGIVQVPGLGGFRVKHVETEKEGAKVMVKRVLFTAAKPVVKI